LPSFVAWQHGWATQTGQGVKSKSGGDFRRQLTRAMIMDGNELLCVTFWQRNPI